MGISQDHWHRRFKTGGKRNPYHKKQKYGLGRLAANTKLGIHTVHVRGGNKKYHTSRLDVGNFSWDSKCYTHKTRMVDVVYSAPNNERVCPKTLVKNWVTLIESPPYPQRTSPAAHCPYATRRGPGCLPRRKRF
ncbi:hypothetical protein GH733_008901 [Mirounga leonina]|nr:hypothetical protein GH733_008901 [Mirounga leonina]